MYLMATLRGVYVILQVRTSGGISYGETSEEIHHLAMSAIGENKVLRDAGEFAGRHLTASLSFIDVRNGEQDRFPFNLLLVSVNQETRFGALTWCVTDRSGKSGGIYDYVWISNNLDPPTGDPRVVVESTCQSFHSPQSCLPIAEIRASVEEFCQARTGERPESINWIKGQMNGWRVDNPAGEEEFDTSSGPWS
jgi:hypothetical protein